MKNIFNETDRNEILERIEKLSPDSRPLWGKMNAAQMMAHCYNAYLLAIGEINAKRVEFPINIIGRLVKPGFLGESPTRKNSPTAPEIKITDERNFQKEKMNLTSALQKMGTEGERIAKAQTHPFFGKMSPNEWGRLTYKHNDHHLKQFGA